MSVDLCPCFCRDCAGQPRNRTTVRRHFERRNLVEEQAANSHADTPCQLWPDSDSDCSHNNGTLEPVTFDSESNSDDIGLDDNSDSDIKRFVLRHLKNKVQHGMSQETTLSGLRNLFELLGDDRIPHQNWNAVLAYLRELGYQDARVYKICFGSDHVKLMENKECCVDCGKQWKDGITYFVLGFNFEDTFLDTQFLLARMAYWKAKEEWFNQQGQLNCNLKEI